MAELYELLKPIHENTDPVVTAGDGIFDYEIGEVYRYRWRNKDIINKHGSDCSCQPWMARDIRCVKLEEKAKPRRYFATPYSAPPETNGSIVDYPDRVFVSEDCLAEKVGEGDEVEEPEELMECGNTVREGRVYQYDSDTHKHGEKCDPTGFHTCPCCYGMRVINTVRVLDFEKEGTGVDVGFKVYTIVLEAEKEEYVGKTFTVHAHCLDNKIYE